MSGNGRSDKLLPRRKPDERRKLSKHERRLAKGLFYPQPGGKRYSISDIAKFMDTSVNDITKILDDPEIYPAYN
jgi:hypothetical protein